VQTSAEESGYSAQGLASAACITEEIAACIRTTVALHKLCVDFSIGDHP